MQRHKPHYYPPDVYSLLMRGEPLNYLKLSNGGLLRFLKSINATGQGYRKFLSFYRDVLCEPLEPLYLARRGSTSLDLNLLQDLLFASSWREANWGAWLAVLAPQPQYSRLLSDRRSTLPHGTDIIDLALASCGENVPASLQHHFELCMSIRELLDEIPCARILLRPSLGADLEQKYKDEVEDVRNAYRHGGARDANAQIAKGIIGYYYQSHQDWLKHGAPPPSLISR